MSKYSDFLARLESYGIDPKYGLGQNFIYDENLLNELASACEAETNARILEIGSGFGTLTEALLRQIPDGRLLSYEIDRSLEGRLDDLAREYQRFTPKFADAQSADYQEDAEFLSRQQIEHQEELGSLHLVGNLPYYITTVLMEKALVSIPDAKTMCFMVQAEVWDRIKALPEDGKTYGVLAVLCHLYGSIEKLMDLSADMFYPQPRVNSVFVRLTRREDTARNPLFEGDGIEFIAFVNSLMAARRKTIANNLNRADLLPGRKERILAELEKIGHSTMLRAEKLNPWEMALLFYA